MTGHFPRIVLGLFVWLLLFCEPCGAWDPSPAQRAWLAAHRVLPVLVDGDWPPIDYLDGDGRYQGVAAAYLRVIGERLGVTFQTRPQPDITRVLRLLADGEAPLAASIVDTPKRRARGIRFTRPFLMLHYRIVARRDVPGIHRLDDLRGRVVAVERGVATVERLRRDYPGVRLKPVVDTAAALKAVSWGEADAYVGNGEAAAWLIRQLGLNNLRFAGEAGIPAAPLAFAVPDTREWRPLAALIDQALKAVPEDERRRIRQRWLSPLADDRARHFEVSAAEREWIANHPVIRIGSDRAWRPVEFQEAGEFKGISADYVRLLNERLGLNMRHVPGLTWEQVLSGVERGDIDVVPAITPLDAWRDRLLFTRPYLSFPFVVFTRDDAGFIRGLEDLSGRHVVVEAATVAKSRLEQDYPELHLIVVPDTAKAVETLSLGKADAYVGNLVTARAIAESRGYTNIRVAAPTPYHYDLAFGVRKDWPELRDLLERGLASIDEGVRSRIHHRWLGMELDDALARRALRRQLVSVALFMSPIVLLLLAWALTMRHRRNQLRASEARFRQAMEAVSEGIWELDQGTGKLYFSPGFFHALGYADDEIPTTDQAWERLIHPDDRPVRREQLARLDCGEAGDGITRIEYRVRRADGSWAPVVGEGRVTQRDSRGRALKCIGTLRDLSNLKSAQARAERFGRALEDNPLMIVITDPKGRIEYVNRRITELMGYRPDEVLGWPASRFVSPDADPKTLEALRKALGGRKRWRGELLHRRRDGQSFWMAVSVSPIFDDHGQLSHFVATDEDISERKAMEASLKHSERQLQHIIDAIPLAIVIVDMEGRILMANPQATREVTRDTSLVGRFMHDFYAHAEDRERFLALLRTERRATGQHIVYRTDWGERIDGLVSAIPIRYAGRAAHLGVMVNLTERVRLEKALAEARDAAESANRLKSRFLANMSHEIRTPLNAVIGLSHLTLNTDLTARQRDYLRNIVAAGQSLLGLINDILDLSRIEAGRMPIERTGFSLDELLSGVAGQVALKAAEKGLELLFSVGDGVPERLHGEPLRLAQVLVNLVQNAIKFTEEGEILVQVALVDEQPERVRLAFTVSDSGPGIPAQEQTRLFEPFTQLGGGGGSRAGGVGLGLAICKSLVELMGGSIALQSRPGLGASFHFELPFARWEREARPAGALRGLEAARALVVDGNPVASVILVSLLESLGLSVELAASGEQVLRRLSDDGQGGGDMPIDILFMDWRLPGIDGIEVARRIQAAHGRTSPRLVLLTRFGQQNPALNDAQVHWHGFLVKPYTRRQLLDTLLSVNAGGSGRALVESAPAWLARRLRGEVLVVEDNAINQQVARALLEGMGLTVTLADGGETALRRLAERSWDLVLMDVAMEGLDGLETTRRIRAMPDHGKVPIVAMTAHAVSGDRERCLAAGMDAYLSKPIDPRQLLELLARWLPEEPPRPPASDAITQAPRLPGLDCRAGLLQSGRDPVLYHRLLEDFIEVHGGEADKLRARWSDPDAQSERLRRLHTLAGVAAHLGARPLAERARRMEQALRAGEAPRAADLDTLDQSLRQVVESAHQCLRYIADDVSSQMVVQAEESAGSPSLEDLARAIAAGSADAMRLFEQIGRDSLPEPLYDDFERLEALLRDYEFNEAARQLEKLRARMNRI